MVLHAFILLAASFANVEGGYTLNNLQSSTIIRREDRKPTDEALHTELSARGHITIPASAVESKPKQKLKQKNKAAVATPFRFHMKSDATEKCMAYDPVAKNLNTNAECNQTDPNQIFVASGISRPGEEGAPQGANEVTVADGKKVLCLAADGNSIEAKDLNDGDDPCQNNQWKAFKFEQHEIEDCFKMNISLNDKCVTDGMVAGTGNQCHKMAVFRTSANQTGCHADLGETVEEPSAGADGIPGAASAGGIGGEAPDPQANSEVTKAIAAGVDHNEQQFKIKENGTCDEGWETITDKDACLNAARDFTEDTSKDFKPDMPAGGYNDTTDDRPHGCTLHEGKKESPAQFFPMAKGDCGVNSFACLCKKKQEHAVSSAAPAPPSPPIRAYRFHLKNIKKGLCLRLEGVTFKWATCKAADHQQQYLAHGFVERDSNKAVDALNITSYNGKKFCYDGAEQEDHTSGKVFLAEPDDACEDAFSHVTLDPLAGECFLLKWKKGEVKTFVGDGFAQEPAKPAHTLCMGFGPSPNGGEDQDMLATQAMCPEGESHLEEAEWTADIHSQHCTVDEAQTSQQTTEQVEAAGGSVDDQAEKEDDQGDQTVSSGTTTGTGS
jgi:hypothetical protein